MSRSIRLESGFQDQVIKEVKQMLPGCLVFKMDQQQGIPDLLVLNREKWAVLETKRYEGAHRQPNQSYYIRLLNRWSFARFICPENKEEVLRELFTAFKS